MRQRLTCEILYYLLICDKRDIFILNNFRKRKNAFSVIYKSVAEKRIKCKL